MAVYTDEQSMLRDAAVSWARSRMPVSHYRAFRDNSYSAGFDRDLFAEMAEMGWAGILVPEEYGGADFGQLSFGVVLESLGRHLATSPLVPSAVGAASALLFGGTGAQKSEWLAGIASGERVVALALDEEHRHAPLDCTLDARAEGDDWILTGEKTGVFQGNGADGFIVSARTSGKPGEAEGITLFLLPADAPGLSREPLVEIDVRGACTVRFDNVRAGADGVLAGVGEGAGLLEQLLDRVRAAMAAEMLGTAVGAFDLTMDYLKTREQFGQIIGSFQALQHRAAAMLGEIEMTRTAVEAALAGIDADDPNVPALVSTAKAFAGDTLKLVAAEMIQMHGGIGMTDEHDAGLYYKRAFAADQAFGSSSYHRERFARLTGN